MVRVQEIGTDSDFHRNPNGRQVYTYTQHAKNTHMKCTMAGAKMSGAVID